MPAGISSPPHASVHRSARSPEAEGAAPTLAHRRPQLFPPFCADARDRRNLLGAAGPGQHWIWWRDWVEQRRGQEMYPPWPRRPIESWGCAQCGCHRRQTSHMASALLLHRGDRHSLSIRCARARPHRSMPRDAGCWANRVRSCAVSGNARRQFRCSRANEPRRTGGVLRSGERVLIASAAWPEEPPALSAPAASRSFRKREAMAQGFPL